MELQVGVVPVKQGYKISKQKNKCVRILFFAHSRDSVASYLNLLQILTLENNYLI